MTLNWVTSTVTIDELKEYKNNPRTISKADFDRLVRDIKLDGYHRRILVDYDNAIVGGHSRKKALLAAGLKKTDQIEVLKASRPLTATEFKRLNIKDNLSFGDFDVDILANNFELSDLAEWGMNIDDLNFPIIEDINEIEEELLTQDDLPIEPKTKLNDVWILDNHRLMCGDSTNEQDIDTLLAGHSPDLIYTDPPYGINLNLRSRASKGSSIINDKCTSVARKTYELITKKFNTPIIYWGGNYFTDFLPPSRCWIAWDKFDGKWDNLSFCGTELAYTNLNKHAKIIKVEWSGFNMEGEKGVNRVHPTQKPIKLALQCFDYAEAGSNVLDLFGGSGSTLLACESSNRNCYMMELDPRYCDVIIKRWEEKTNKKTILEEKTQ